MATLNQAWKPVAGGERIATIDILRGVAVLGILVVNMGWFGWPLLWTSAGGFQLWTSIIDRISHFFIQFLFEGKFISMFSFLFGLGMAIQLERAAVKGQRFTAHYARRLVVLLGFGLIHGILFWTGDVLAAYAVIGFLLLAFRNRSPRSLVRWAMVILCIPLVVNLLMWGSVFFANQAQIPEVMEILEEQMAFFTQRVEESLVVFSQGTFGEITARRIQDFSFMWSSPFMWLPLPLTMMLIGLAVGKMGIAQDLAGHRDLLKKVVWWCLPVGLVANFIFAVAGLLGHGIFDASVLFLVASLAHTIGAPLLALGYLAGLSLLSLQEGWQLRLKPFGAVGRMAFSNYLLHTLIGTTIFYSYGLGLYGQVGPAVGLILTVVIFGLQLVLSPWWLQRFHSGPAEWLWRTLTYGKAQPFAIARDQGRQIPG